MSELDDALVQVDRALGWSDGERELERVEVARDGRLLFTVRTPERCRWFAYAAGDLLELRPEHDSKVPLCSAIAAVQQVVSWRPGRRICLGTEWRGEVCFAKGYRSGRSAPAARNHALVHAACWAPGTFTVPRVLHEDSALGALFLAPVPGARLTVRSGRAATFLRVGRALRCLQRDVDTGGLELHSAGDELALLQALAERMRPVLGADVPGWFDTFARVRARPLPETPTVASHRDLHPDQLLHAPNAVGLVDFDLLCRAHPLLDLANLTAHLRLRALQGLDGSTHVDADDCAHAVLEGYGMELSRDERRDLRFFQATTFLRLALIYAIRPRWMNLAPQLAQLAERCIHG